MVRTALACLLLAFASNASAFFDPPTTSPENPLAGQNVSVHFRHGVCDAVFGDIDDGEVALASSVVSLTLDGGHAYDPIFCNYPVAVMTFRIGAFPEGEYLVNVYHRYTDFFGVVQTVLVGSTTFAVSGAAVHHAIPASGNTSALILLLCIALTGILAANALASRGARS